MTPCPDCRLHGAAFSCHPSCQVLFERGLIVLDGGLTRQRKDWPLPVFLLVLFLTAFAGLALLRYVGQPVLCAVNGPQAHSYCPGYVAEGRR